LLEGADEGSTWGSRRNEACNFNDSDWRAASPGDQGRIYSAIADWLQVRAIAAPITGKKRAESRDRIMAEPFSTPGIMALAIMLRPASSLRACCKIAVLDIFGQPPEISQLLVFDRPGSHFVKAAARRIGSIGRRFKRRIVSSKFQKTIASEYFV
jgi:hypothetical protein